MTEAQQVSSGIYGILHPASGRIYVGSAQNITRRLMKHRYELCKGIHHSRHLQNAWNKYGKDAFTYKVLELVPDFADLLPREQFWIDAFIAYKKGRGFNIRKIAESAIGLKRTDETKAKMSAALKGRIVSAESRIKIGLAQIGRKLTPEAVAKTAAANRGRKMSPEAIAKSAAATRARKVSIETRAKQSTAKKGKKLSAEAAIALAARTRGRIRSEEFKAKVSASGKIAWRRRKDVGFVGKPCSPETRAKIGAAQRKYLETNAHRQKGVPHTEETKAKISAAHKGKKHSVETIARMQTPEYKAMLSARTKQWHLAESPESKAKRLAAMTGQKRSAECRAAISASITPERKAKLRQEMLAYHADRRAKKLTTLASE